MPQFHAETPQANASEGLAKGPYFAARAGFERNTTSLPMGHHAPFLDSAYEAVHSLAALLVHPMNWQRDKRGRLSEKRRKKERIGQRVRLITESRRNSDR